VAFIRLLDSVKLIDKRTAYDITLLKISFYTFHVTNAAAFDGAVKAFKNFNSEENINYTDCCMKTGKSTVKIKGINTKPIRF
jgi:hypothetical protein